MALPETAADAVKAYDAGQQLEAVPLVPGLDGAQNKFWADVFNVLRAAGELAGAPGHKWTYSFLQFDSWCLGKGLQQPRRLNPVVAGKPEVAKYDPAEVKRCDAVKGAAFGILREGYRNMVERRAPQANQRIPIRKG